MTIDFLPPQDIRGLRTRVIGEETIVAMYMNNRAAEAFIGGQLERRLLVGARGDRARIRDS